MTQSIDKESTALHGKRASVRSVVYRLGRATLLWALVASLAVTCLTWFRSYSVADRLHGRLGNRASLLLGSKQGRIVGLFFWSPGHANWWQWELRSYGVESAMSFPTGPVRQYESFLGLGWLKNPLYFVMDPVQQRPDGTTIMLWGAASATLRGQGFLIPHWLMVSVLFTLTMVVGTGFPIRLRILVVWFTILGMILALAAATER